MSADEPVATGDAVDPHDGGAADAEDRPGGDSVPPAADDGEHTRPTLRWGLVGKRSTQVLATALSAILFVLTGYGWYDLRLLRSGQHTVHIAGLGPPTTPVTPSASASSLPTASTNSPDASPAAPVALPGTGAAQNILLVGVDSRAGLTAAQRRYLHLGQHDQTTSTDTIMLLHVPADGSRATLISIPRDTYVSIPGYNSNKINAAYADGYYLSGAQGTGNQQAAGAEELVATVKALTGVQIDHYVQVGFAGFVDVVRAIGDIPVDLCASVDDTHKHNVAEGTNGGSGFVMSAGHHDLTPRQALEFVRQRHNIPGPITDDLGRELRQRYFLSAVFRKVMSAGVLFSQSKLRSLITAVDNALTFDDQFDVLKLAGQLSHLTVGNIRSAAIPTTGNRVIDGQAVLTADPAAVRRFVEERFYGSASPPERHHKHGAHVTAPPAQQDCVY